MNVPDQFTGKLIAHDLLNAARSVQEACRRLFYIYDRANKTFSEEAGQVDPRTVHIGISAQGYGLLAMSRWLKEVGTMEHINLSAAADEMEVWLAEWLADRGLELLESPTP
jgi:hypothetical protein